jgi:hypothetical protein
MKISIDKACFEGIIKPGELYILNAQGDKRFNSGSIEDLYWIRCEAEIATAVEMEIGIYMSRVYEFREFNGVCKVNDNCYKLDLVCYDLHQKEDRQHPLYLHRINSFGEMLAKAKKLFGVE